MWRTRAVISMLVEDVGGLQAPDVEAGETEDPAADEIVERGVRRAILVIVVDCLAILILFLLRDRSTPFLPLDQTVETVFTFGVLAVAFHAGFRWAQLEKLRTIRRLCDELQQRREA